MSGYPPQRALPFFPEVHGILTKSWHASYSARLRNSSSSAVTTVDGAEEKGYGKLPPLNESVAVHLCPPTAIGWKAKAAHPSKPCRANSALAGCAYTSAGQAALAFHSMADLQFFQAKLLRSTDKNGSDPTAFREPHSVTNLALYATNTTAQSIGRSMASLVVLERHMWLNLTEIKDADNIPFLDSLVSPTDLFGLTVEGFAERFTAAEKSSQAMQHFLLKRSSSAAGSSHSRTAPTPQPAKTGPPAVQPDLARPDVANLLTPQDPGPRLCWTQRLSHRPDIRDRKREGSSRFEPLQSVDLQSLMLKTTLLLALALVKPMGDWKPLSMSPTTTRSS